MEEFINHFQQLYDKAKENENNTAHLDDAARSFVLGQVDAYEKVLKFLRSKQ